jgi:hypothetical protein
VTNVQIGSLGVSDFILAPVSPTQIIEQAGSTSLVQVGNGFFMPSVGATSGPQLMIGGAPVVAETSGAWRPIAAEAACYVVAWKNGEADQFGVWNTDTKGNYLWIAMGAVPGSNHAIDRARHCSTRTSVATARSASATRDRSWLRSIR